MDLYRGSSAFQALFEVQEIEREQPVRQEKNINLAEGEGVCIEKKENAADRLRSPQKNSQWI